MKRLEDILIILIIVLVICTTSFGLLSFKKDSGYMIKNQYGDDVKIYGHGLYQHDSHFRAYIFMGTDAAELILGPILLSYTYLKYRKSRNRTHRLYLSAVLGCILYYATSMAFGVTYNKLHLVYIALFSTTFFTFIHFFHQSLNDGFQVTKDHKSLGIKLYCIIGGLMLGLAWLPDIITSLVSNRSLELIEVYTTEITYVIDMGIISPLLFMTLYLIQKEDKKAVPLLTLLLSMCIAVAFLLPMQTLFQSLGGIEVPIDQLITKAVTFILLGIVSIFLMIRVVHKNLDQ